jgi:hypothetical protein
LPWPQKQFSIIYILLRLALALVLGLRLALALALGLRLALALALRLRLALALALGFRHNALTPFGQQRPLLPNTGVSLLFTF